MTITEIIKKTLLAGVGAGEKFKEFVDELAKAGEVSTNEASKLVKEWSEKAQQSTKDLDSRVRDAIGGAFEKMNIATRADMERLEKKLQNISERLSKIEGGGQ
jgi:polyhydroxyalkanoate synthesis regulator phasin